MAGQNNFQSLRQHSTKVYKFSQGKSIPLLKPQGELNGSAVNAVTLSDDDFNAIKGGVCAALTAAWLKEKQGSTKAFAGNYSGPGVHAGRNLKAVKNAAPHQIVYKRDPLSTDMDILAQYGLKQSTKVSGSDALVRKMVVHSHTDTTGRIHKTPISEIQLSPSIEKALSEGFLAQGRGVYMGFTLVSTDQAKNGGGHAVGAYRSRGNTLYFFDSNCGVYNVTDPGGFVAAWINCYAILGYKVTLNITHHDGFKYTDR